MMIINDRTRGPMFSLVVLLSLAACGGGGGASQGAPLGGSPPTAPAAPPAIAPVDPENHAPTIAGSPVTSGQTQRPYAFKPNAADVDGDGLTFSISGKPNWAAFDAATGVLSGTPPMSGVGTYRGIAINVSDGKLSTALAPFSITVSAAPTQSVTLRWKPPTKNVDSTALTDLAGYVVSYGLASRSYTTTFKVVIAGSTSVVIEGFEPGTWYFAMKAVNGRGVQSAYSGEVVAVL